MKSLKKICILFVILFFCYPKIAFLQNDLLDTAFQPSKNLDHIINIGNNKNAVGNEIFRGGTDIEASLWLVKACFRILPLSQDKCTWWLNKWAFSVCVQLPATTTIEEDRCLAWWGIWEKIPYSRIVETPPLLVRITQTLLRLTIGLSIPMIIWIGIKVIKAGLNGWEIKDSLKEVWWILIGLALALSAIGIIYLIQSITTQSLTF